jgi:predicted transcriptional regulator of viral defense system
MAVNYLYDYLKNIRTKGGYAFTFDELKHNFDLSDKAIRQSLFRLIQKNEIAVVRKGFYVVLPPEYAKNGELTVYLYIDDLMKFLKQDYYLGLYSAAALYGAAHQQPMYFQVIAEKPMRSIEQANSQINFFVRKNFPSDFVEKKKSAAGYFNVSSPELTALDFMLFSGKIGGMTRIVPVLSELIDAIKPLKLQKTANAYWPVSALQRLGYLFDKVFARQDLANAVKKGLKNRTLQTVSLSVSSPVKKTVDKDWRIDVNVPIENDL